MRLSRVAPGIVWGVLATCVALPGAACGPAREDVAPPDPRGAAERMLYAQDFDSAAPGVLGEASFSSLFRSPARSIGVAAGRVAIVEDGRTAGRFLRVSYPAGRWASAGGAIWRIDLRASVDEAWLSYRVRFEDGFDYVRGGKLPGLGGGTTNTGGRRPTGTDGWSARMMWRAGGRAVFYVYHPDQSSRFGDDLRWGSILRPVRFRAGIWHHVVHHVVLNTPGEHDGRIRGWMDGELVADYSGVRFRDIDEIAIDALLFSTFFGGSGPEWAPDAEQVADFDEFLVWTPAGTGSGD